MSNPDRIPILLEKLHTLWLRQPEMQFGQIVFDLYLKIPETWRSRDGTINFFDVEDATFERYLDLALKTD